MHKKLRISRSLEHEARQFLSSNELIVLKDLSQDLKEGLKKHNGSIVKATDELCTDCYIITVSNIIIYAYDYKDYLVAVDWKDLPSFIKEALEFGYTGR